MYSIFITESKAYFKITTELIKFILRTWHQSSGTRGSQFDNKWHSILLL